MPKSASSVACGAAPDAFASPKATAPDASRLVPLLCSCQCAVTVQLTGHVTSQQTQRCWGLLNNSSSPVDVSIIVFGLLKRMSDVALCHSQRMTHQTRNQIPIAVVAYEEVRVVAMASSVQLFLDGLCGVLGKPLQIGPHLKPAAEVIQLCVMIVRS